MVAHVHRRSLTHRATVEQPVIRIGLALRHHLRQDPALVRDLLSSMMSGLPEATFYGLRGESLASDPWKWTFDRPQS